MNLNAQHNLVDPFLFEEETHHGKRKYTTYIANSARILNILRFPRLLTRLNYELGLVAEAVVESLHEHGRLKWKQAARSAREKIVQAIEAATASGESHLDESAFPPHTLTDVHTVMVNLVQERYIERVPPCSLPPPTIKVHPNVTSNKRARVGLGGSSVAPDARAQALALYARERFAYPSPAVVLGPEDHNNNGGETRKRSAFEANLPEIPGDLTPTDVDALWRINFDELNRRMRHQVCANFMLAKLGEDAAGVLQAALSISKETEMEVRTPRSIALGVMDLRARVREMEVNGVVPEGLSARFEVAIDDIVESNTQAMESVGEGPGGTMYVVNHQRLIDFSQVREAEAVVLSQFGQEGLSLMK